MARKLQAVSTTWVDRWWECWWDSRWVVWDWSKSVSVRLVHSPPPPLFEWPINQASSKERASYRVMYHEGAHSWTWAKIAASSTRLLSGILSGVLFYINARSWNQTEASCYDPCSLSLIAFAWSSSLGPLKSAEAHSSQVNHHELLPRE